MDYSVLMSVYHKEKPDYLRQSMESIFCQTVNTNDFVLVCDGSLTEDLEAVVSQMQKKFGDVLNVVRLKKNLGLGKALNYGMHFCKNEVIARMDSDDISRPDRCEKQLRIFSSMPEVDICSGVVEEFSTSPEIINSRRVPPERHEEIQEFIKKRNPFNHPCVMYKKSAVEAAGGYQDFYMLEDYFLWVRMFQKGYIGYNLQQPLLWMRAGADMYRRRSGWKYAKSQKALFKYMKDSGFITIPQYILSVTSRSVSSILPNKIRETLFETFMRVKEC